MTKTAKILLIDDEDDLRMALAELLEEEGYSVAQVRDGQKGLEYLRSNPLPHLILLDYMMPIMGGEEFCHQLNMDLKLNSVPVVLVSAATISDSQLLKMKAVTFIQKPINIDTFLELVSKYSSKS